LLAHQRLGRSEIMAEIVTCTRKEAYLQSLVENIARTKPGSMDFARELKRLHDEGWSIEKIARVACKSDNYIREFIRLVEQGEDRLIRGVEQGVFPINFATRVATADDSQQQNLLMDAFDAGLVTSSNFAQARQIMAARLRDSKSRANSAKYSVHQLRQDIVEATRVKTSYVREAKSKEHRFMTLLSGISALWRDEAFVRLVRDEKLLDRPELAGDFRYET
jgi:ParB family chromosome partitioning protein